LHQTDYEAAQKAAHFDFIRESHDPKLKVKVRGKIILN